MDSEPVGFVMYKKKGQLSESPVACKDDNQENQMLRELVRSMISYKPEDRPSIGVVQTKLKAILGECYLTFIVTLVTITRSQMILKFF